MKSRRELMFGAAGLGALLVASSAQARTLSVSVSPDLLEGAGFDLTDDSYATVSGGVPPYSYQWVRTSGSANIVANDPTGSFTNFYWNGAFGGPAKLSRWVCQVTDATSATANSNVLTVAFDPN